MPKYDVHPAPEAGGHLLDVQTDLLDGLNTRVVVPLLPEAAAPKPGKTLNPVFDIDGEPYIMATQFLSAVPTSMLGTPTANLSARSDEITRALDMLLQGF